MSIALVRITLPLDHLVVLGADVAGLKVSSSREISDALT
jgi:hypothetical protein